MPAYQVGKSQVVHFGYGDVFMGQAQGVADDGRKTNELVFIEHEHEHEVGTRTQEFCGKSTAELDCPVRLIFDNINSLDVLVLVLGELRERMVADANSPQPM